MSRPIDAVTFEVLWSRLISIVNEQAAALMHASFTTVVREAGDLSAGVFDAEGNMLAQAVTGTPGHINTMATCVRHFVKKHPLERFTKSLGMAMGEAIARVIQTSHMGGLR